MFIYNKQENMIRNIISGFINKIVMIFCPFIVRTIIIWKLGIEYVGLNSLFTSILQVLSLAELGFGSAIVYSMYEPIAKNDKLLICALLNVYKKVYNIIGMIILGLGVFILPLLPKIIAKGCPNDINIYILFIIFLSNTLLSYFMYAYKQSLLMAHQRIDIESNIMTISNFIMYICQIIILVFIKNYYIYILFLPIFTVVINLSRSRKVSELYPEYICRGDISDDLKADMKKRVIGLTLTRVCHVCRNSFDSIVISLFLGLTVLGRYQNYYYVMNTIIGFLTIITTSVVAGVGNSMVVKTIEENYDEFKIFQFYYNWISTWCAVCLLCLFQPFMKIWVGTENMMSFLLVILMFFYFYVLKVGDIVAVYKEAAGIYWEDRKRPIVESVANLILNIVLVKVLGIYGVVLSTIITIAFINIPWSAIILFQVYFKKNIYLYFKSLMSNLLKLIFVSIITFLICDLIRINGWLEIILKLLICIIIPNIIMFILNLKDPKIKIIKVKINK